jgi:hypothetical protein
MLDALSASQDGFWHRLKGVRQSGRLRAQGADESSHRKIIDWISRKPPSRILDLGCSNGRLGELLVATGTGSPASAAVPPTASTLTSTDSSKRIFDAIVIGEPARAVLTPPVMHCVSDVRSLRGRSEGPRGRGQIDADSAAHDMMMTLFGGMSQAERARIKLRVRWPRHPRPPPRAGTRVVTRIRLPTD